MPSRIIAMILALLVLGPPAFAQTAADLTQSDVDAALAQRRDAGAELEELTGRYQRSMFDEELARERPGPCLTSSVRLVPRVCA